MSIKGKILSTISIFALAIVLTFVGVWALTDLDFTVGGNITYTAPVVEITAKDESEYPTMKFVVISDTEKTCYVQQNTANPPSGEVVIPEAVIKSGVQYTIIHIGDINEVYMPGMGYGFCENLNITSIIIPETIMAVQEFIFSGCSNLKTIFIKNPNVITLKGPLSATSFSSDLIIYVPTASLNAYKTANRWSNYSNKITAYDF